MPRKRPPAFEPFSRDTLRPRTVQVLRRVEAVSMVLGVAAAIFHHGLRQITTLAHVEMGAIVLVAMLFLAVSLVLRDRWSRVRSTFRSERRIPIVLTGIWLAGCIAILTFRPLFPDWSFLVGGRAELILQWSELLISLRAAAGLLIVTRRAAAGGLDPAVLLVLSFLGLIAVGTALLMLPNARPHLAVGEAGESTPFLTALFTATSASCVTGLVVEETGIYWSRTGQAVILCLIQLGGLGIMTFSATFAIFMGGRVNLRENATLRDLLESEEPARVRRLITAIVGFTLVSELVGAIGLSGLWSDRTWGEQWFQSIFHSVSSFCNAGFALTENSFVGMSRHWQVWGLIPLLVIIGGLGFAVLDNVVLSVRSWLIDRLRGRRLFEEPRRRHRLSLSARVILVTTAVLLVVGMLGHFVLEAIHTGETRDLGTRIADSWFQSVTARTAGFNTIDQSELGPASKLVTILLMFIGASPGSTGGGIKTSCFALVVLTMLSYLRGEQRISVSGRTIPGLQVNRALTIVALGTAIVLAITLALVLFEQQPNRFLDHLFEAVSAFGTVGLSADVTPGLSAPSRVVIIIAMFAGRVGPLTLLIALTRQREDSRYDYPPEKVILG